MSPSQTVETTLWIAMILQTIDNVDAPGAGPRKLPAPKAYAALFIVWTVLGWAADSGPAGARGARSMSWLIVLVTLVLGGAGQKLVTFLTGVANLYGTGPGSPSPVASTSSSTTTATTSTTQFT